MIVGVVQARCSSTRLPGKVLEPIVGRPMLARQIERLRRCREVNELRVATSREPSDDALAALCQNLGVPCHRGALEDVLDRFYHAAKPGSPDHVVRLTGDCPLTDPALVDAVIAEHRRAGNDYTSNALRRTYPDGLDAEVMTWACLESAWREAELRSDREHVTPFIYRQPERFKLGSVEGERDLSEMRWTVDWPADLAFVRSVYERLYPTRPDFGMADVLALLEREAGGMA